MRLVLASKQNLKQLQNCYNHISHKFCLYTHSTVRGLENRSEVSKRLETVFLVNVSMMVNSKSQNISIESTFAIN